MRAVSTPLRELSPDGATLNDPLPVDRWDDLIRDPASHRLIGTVALVEDDLRYSYFDPEDQAAWDGGRGSVSEHAGGPGV